MTEQVPRAPPGGSTSVCTPVASSDSGSDWNSMTLSAVVWAILSQVPLRVCMHSRHFLSEEATGVPITWALTAVVGVILL